MKFQGLTKLKKDIEIIQENIEKNIDDIDSDNKNADKQDEDLNDVWTELDQMLDILDGINDI